jgi:hypothetical protein
MLAESEFFDLRLMYLLWYTVHASHAGTEKTAEDTASFLSHGQRRSAGKGLAEESGSGGAARNW